jgi:hypothetical protein
MYPRDWRFLQSKGTLTCYEILTRKLPFEGHSHRDYDLILDGGQLEVQEYADNWARELLNRC